MMQSVELQKFDEDHYISDYIYGKEDYLYTEFCDYLPDWVKADRIIRKQLKEMESKPIVPKSDLDLLAQFDQPSPSPSPTPPTPVVIPETVERVESKSRLIEVIDDHEETTEKEETITTEEKAGRMEKLDSGFHMPSLLIQPIVQHEDKQQQPQQPQQPQEEQTNSIPVITKKEGNIAKSMREYCLSTVHSP